MVHIKHIFLDEYFEPALGRATRVTLAFILPLVWGLFTGHMEAAVWVAIGAQVLSFATVEGSYPIKLLVIGGAIVACGISGLLGTLMGGHWLVATIVMILLAFLAGFVRQSGVHGPGIAIGVLLVYLLTLDHPGGFSVAGTMVLWLTYGGLIALGFTLLSWVFIPFSPFRRSVSYTWKAMSDWLHLLAVHAEDKAGQDTDVDEMDEQELTFREELSNSTDILSRRQAIAHARQNRLSYQLVELRRIVSFANPAVSAIRDALENIKGREGYPFKLIGYLMDNLSQATRRIAISIISNRPEHIYTAGLSIEKAKNNMALLKADLPKSGSGLPEDQLLQSISELMEYLQEAIRILEQIGAGAGHMTFFMRNFFTGMTVPQKIPVVRIQLSTHSFTFRFSLRLALAMGIGVAVYKLFHIPHGYWIAMTTMIILQPEFGATFTKAWRRIKGTILGAIVGSLLFLLPLPLPVSLAIVILCCFTMAYYIQHNYALAAFIITVMVIALYHLMEPVTWELGLIRVLNTIGGAGLALLGGYAFFPLWERYRFPALIEKAIRANATYLDELLSVSKRHHRTNMDFVKTRREAEVNNSNAFQSLRRMKEEPSQKQTNRQPYYIIMGYNIRLTRLLKTYNQQLVKAPGLYFPNAQMFKAKIEEILGRSASLMAGQYEVDSTPLPPADELVRQMEQMLDALPETDSGMREKAKNLFERMARETIGLYYAILQVRKD